MSFTDGWQTSSSHLYPSNVSSLMPIDSQEIQSSVYYDTTPSATNLNGDNRSTPLDHNGYEMTNTYNPSSLVGQYHYSLY